jgi:hypothetical protein
MLRRATEQSQGHLEPMVFVNAWNEWAEGAHLEPGSRTSRAALEAVADCRPRLDRDGWA